jgi:hypothetical protein
MQSHYLHLRINIVNISINQKEGKQAKQSHNTSMEAQDGEEVKLLLVHDLGTTWG